ncbi:MAG: MBL fold metallo-hydrolase [Planctomycetota bacterium]
MRITLCGAAGEVTGSCYWIEHDGHSILVDCGLFQGDRNAGERNRRPFPFAAREIEAVLLTHAHLDHTGRLPMLVRDGFTGPIHATPASMEIARLILDDSAAIQVADAERMRRRALRQDGYSAEPLYLPEHVEKAIRLLRPARYNKSFTVVPGLAARFVDSGHILGSTSIELIATSRRETGSQPQRVIFSGDIGPRGTPLLRDPVTFEHAELVFLESTYGTHDHRSLAATTAEFEQILAAAGRNRDKVLIPAFAVGRTQQLFYHLAEAVRTGRIPRFPIFLDSPMAIEATELYRRFDSLYDVEAAALATRNQFEVDLSELKYARTPADSIALNDLPGPCLIIAGAGMCTGGRIVHHLKHNLWKEECVVIMVGYQANGTLGRQLVNGAEEVRIFGEPVRVRARVHTLGGFSAHAGQSELADWFAPLAKSRPRLVLTHGEPKARAALTGVIEQRFGLSAESPTYGDVVELPRPN